MRKIISSFFLLAFFAAGCATVYYHPEGFTGGYGVRQLDQDVFAIAFSGGSYANPDKVDDAVLLRCAQATLENHFKYFYIMDRAEEERWFGSKPGPDLLIRTFKEKHKERDITVYDAEKVSVELEKARTLKE